MEENFVLKNKSEKKKARRSSTKYETEIEKLKMCPSEIEK
jgi:hypothetical protein